MLGIAHFVEHLVFMGSKSFENQNGFMKLVNDLGGSANASTSDSTINFFSTTQIDEDNQILAR